VPRIASWIPIGPAGSMNCGRIAVKKTNAFGFAPWVRNPDDQEPSRCVTGSTPIPSSAGRLFADMIMRAPHHIRYAAPHHLTTVKSSHDASSSAPRHVAEMMKYIALADRMPRLARNPADAPRVSESDTTRSTAGPGVKHSTVSVAQKSSQDSTDLEDRNQKSEDRSQNLEVRIQNTEFRIRIVQKRATWLSNSVFCLLASGFWLLASGFPGG
jgi:hypothetical protein